MFLGVNLLDRFLSKGYFKTKRNLQIVGIACLTLARRIEENQPYNSVREKVFQLGSSTYSRAEVVAMEWLVQEVLKFKCYLPTIYDFIWFYLKATRACEKVGKTVNYMAVLALLGFEQLRFWPSTVAAGLIVLASTAKYQNTSVVPIVETNSLEKDDDLLECTETAWVAGQYAHISFSNPNNFCKALHSVVGRMRDQELHVRIDSVFALRSFVEACKDLGEIRLILPQLLDEFFKHMNEVENEDLVFTLDTIVDKFGEEMVPYAIGLCNNLAAAFWKCMNSSEADDGDDPGALAAVGCLRAISTILESICSIPK